MIEALGWFGLFCLLIGVGYPLFAAITYPIYRLLGGRERFWKYMGKI